MGSHKAQQIISFNLRQFGLHSVTEQRPSRSISILIFWW
jgi:hypothetical protein